MTNIAVIGTGYVGLSSGACFARLGHVVTCVDVVEEKVAKLRAGILPIVETGLEELVTEGVSAGRLSFTTDVASAVVDAEVVFLCVPTPEGEDGNADLSYIQTAARTISPLLQTGAIVVNKSTVPVGSTKVVERELKRPDVSVVSNPEFLREGSAIHDFLKPDRVVVGSDDQEAAIKVASLYEKVGAPVVVTDPASAETIKYAANAFLATKISYINAVAAICEGVGADIHDVVLGLGYDHRIGHEFLRPGPGWGGSCFPKDTKALVKIAEDAGYDFGLLKGVITVNEQQYGRIVDKIRFAAGGSVKDKRIAVWGLTFKARTDDLRDSPSVEIVTRLLASGAQVAIFDPTVSAAPRGMEAISVALDPLSACKEADLVAVLTEWDDFRWVSPVDVARVIGRRFVVDARNLLDRSEWKRAGFEYQGIGR
ncbi:MAG: UDP-glucose dehydrogenase family protein [Actinomycetota bacterium]